VKDFLKIAAGPDSKVDHCSLLYDVGLCAQDYVNREINASFSGGELKRIEIASILARDLKVALFDEPEAGIDLWSFQRLTETFRKLNERTSATIVIISHQERILRLADQVILVSDGTISEITTQEKFLGDIEDIDNACRCRISCIKEGKA
jgi:Fe-S cluster assembly ATP-binding protein